MIQWPSILFLIACIPFTQVFASEAGDTTSVAPNQLSSTVATTSAKGAQIKTGTSSSAMPKASMASEGSSGRGGGDVEQFRSDEIEPYVNGSLKNDVLEYLANLSSNQIPDALWPQIGTLIAGIADDIRSHYVLSDHCYDKFGVDRSASTTLALKRADICFNLSKLTSLSPNRHELLALAIHEHARHFGFEDDTSADENNPIYQFVIQNLTSLNGREAILAYVLSSPVYQKMKLGDLAGVKFPWGDSQMGGWGSNPNGDQCNMTHKLTLSFAQTSSSNETYDVTVISLFSPGTDCNDQHLLSRSIEFSKSK